MKTMEILSELRKLGGGTRLSSCHLRDLTIALAERVAALESREEVRHRIKPIMQGEKPEKGVGGT